MYGEGWVWFKPSPPDHFESVSRKCWRGHPDLLFKREKKKKKMKNQEKEQRRKEKCRRWKKKSKEKGKKEKKKRRNGVWIEKGRHTFWVNKERQKRPNEVKIFGRLLLSRVALIFGVSVSRCGPACDGLAWAGQIVSLRTSVSPNMQILREMEMWGGEGEAGWGRRGGGGGGG